MKELLIISICCLFATACTCQKAPEPDIELPADSVATDGQQHGNSLADSNRKFDGNMPMSGREDPDMGEAEARLGSQEGREPLSPAGRISAGENMGNYQTYEDVQAINPMASPVAQARLTEIGTKKATFQTVKSSLPDPAAIYQKHCARCHGKEGRGDGPDENQLGITPTNFLEWELKFGTDIENIVYTTKYGQAEDEMPGFADILKEDEIWSVSFYVHEWVNSRPAN